MKRGKIRDALLASIKKNPGVPCEVTVCCSLNTVGFVVQYLADEWKIKRFIFRDGQMTFETTSARASLILMELRDDYPKGYESGWSKPIPKPLRGKSA
jgi:hypothetical protein